MFGKPSEQNRACGNAEAAASSRSGGYGFADVDRSLEPPVAVTFAYRSVRREITNVVYCVDTGAGEAILWWELGNGPRRIASATLMPRYFLSRGLYGVSDIRISRARRQDMRVRIT